MSNDRTCLYCSRADDCVARRKINLVVSDYDHHLMSNYGQEEQKTPGCSHEIFQTIAACCIRFERQDEKDE